MGEVYLAHDTKLDRKVALKILPAEVATNRDRMERFVREAKSAAALNHPNIAHVYEIGADEGTHYIAMEFIDGDTLREKIHREKAPLTKLLKYLNQVAMGLAKAHGAGIVHRDLKPENIMITRDDYAKVLDFGLAKLVEPQRGFGASDSASSDIVTAVMPQHSTPGMVMGTIGYMSPEQASGLVNEIDHRSDIFSFGCILFEAATGKRAFEGKDALDSLHKIVHAPTPLLKDVNPLAPADLQRVVRRCLAKEPDKRYQSIKELAIELDDLQAELMDAPGSNYSSSQASPALQTTSGTSRTEEGFWIAVLPFKFIGSNTEVAALAEGLAEDIVTGLSRFSYLRVISRSSTLRYATETSDVREVGKTLGARYVLEGSLRIVGSILRVSVQLADSSTGAQLWAETYNRQFRAEEIFVLQDDLVPRIVSTCADHFGVLARSISDDVRGKDFRELSPYEALMRGFGYHHRLTPDEHAQAREALERAVAKAPGNADCWAMLSWIYSHEYAHGYNAQDGSLDRALAAASRAVDFAPSNHFAYQTLAVALFFRKDISGCLSAAERSIALNPLDASNEAIFLITFSGDWERGCSLIRSAMELNPHHPGWYRIVLAINEYRKKHYVVAIDETVKANVRGIFWTNLLLAAAYAQIGEGESARNALRELVAQKPDTAAAVTEILGKWFQPDLVDHLLDGLSKAGLKIIGEQGFEDAASQAKSNGSLSVTASEGRPAIAVLPFENISNDPEQEYFAAGLTEDLDSQAYAIKTIAVLPFQNLSGDPEQEYFADGITEEIINALAQIPGLRVAGRSSSFSFKGRNEDLRSVGAKLNVATILEGTLRRSGDRLRITAQLIDAGNGYQLWSERYDRVVADVFALQDEIANTIAERLQLSLSASVQGQTVQPPTRDIRAYELYLKGRGLLYQRGLSIPKAIDCFKEAVALDPLYAQAWAGLADGYTTSGYSGFTRAEIVMPRALEAARRALELDPNLAEAHNALAIVTLLYERKFDDAEREFKRALQLNPNYPQAHAWYGLFYLHWIAGREREGREGLLRLLQVDPLSGYAHVIVAFSDFASGRLVEAVEHSRRGVELDPNSYLAQWCHAAALKCNEQYEEAAAAAERALSLSGRHCWAMTTLISIYTAWGKRENALAAYLELEERSKREYIQPSMLLEAAAAVGKVDQALAFAQQALDDNDPLFVLMARLWPSYDSLRNNSNFLKIVSKLGLPDWNAQS